MRWAGGIEASIPPAQGLLNVNVCRTRDYSIVCRSVLQLTQSQSSQTSVPSICG